MAKAKTTAPVPHEPAPVADPFWSIMDVLAENTDRSISIRLSKLNERGDVVQAGEINPTEFAFQSLLDNYGPGKYRVQVLDQYTRQHIKGATFSIAAPLGWKGNAGTAAAIHAASGAPGATPAPAESMLEKLLLTTMQQQGQMMIALLSGRGGGNGGGAGTGGLGEIIAATKGPSLTELLGLMQAMQHKPQPLAELFDALTKLQSLTGIGKPADAAAPAGDGADGEDTDTLGTVLKEAMRNPDAAARLVGTFLAGIKSLVPNQQGQTMPPNQPPPGTRRVPNTANGSQQPQPPASAPPPPPPPAPPAHSGDPAYTPGQHAASPQDPQGPAPDDPAAYIDAIRASPQMQQLAGLILNTATAPTRDAATTAAFVATFFSDDKADQFLESEPGTVTDDLCAAFAELEPHRAFVWEIEKALRNELDGGFDDGERLDENGNPQTAAAVPLAQANANMEALNPALAHGGHGAYTAPAFTIQPPHAPPAPPVSPASVVVTHQPKGGKPAPKRKGAPKS